MKAILIKNVKDYQKEITNVFKQLAGNNLTSEVREKNLIIYLNYENDTDLEEMLYAFENSFMINIIAYITQNKEDTEKLKKEEKIAEVLLDALKPGVYNLKSALMTNPRISNQREILDYVLEHTGITEAFITEFVKYDLNVSQASKSMFIHRNTMMYKLDKLKSESGFDLRNFIDAYILYMLICSK